jgi:CHAT domain-containing protein
LRELPSNEPETGVFAEQSDFSLPRLQSTLPSGAALIEYYATGDRLLAAVVTRDQIEVRPVAEVSSVVPLLQLLRFQFAKFRLGAKYIEQFHESFLGATLRHLDQLHTHLIAALPIPATTRHLIFVPHGPLHFLPFHALRNRGEYLCDRYTVSYAPSATLFAFCQQKLVSNSHASLILGIPDPRAPEISSEVHSIASLLPQAELFIGKEATAEALRKHGAQCRLLHIATHGIYRQDNPMFSAVKLGDGYLSLYDLYQLRLGASLVTLSGCATGMNFVAAGDELLGLQRGLFYAGATSLLLSLWDVHDSSTAELMVEFYGSYIRSGDMPGSLQRAMQKLRAYRPHPYFWAPFLLVGNVSGGQPPV